MTKSLFSGRNLIIKAPALLPYHPFFGGVMLRCVNGCLLGITCFSIAIAAQPAASSPSANPDLICPTDTSTGCYSRLFQPTEDFQMVREGQDLPPGLHVRVNIWTGEKEARLNIPMDDGIELDGLPTEQAIVIIDQPEDFQMEKTEPAIREKTLQKPPAYDGAGKIMPPREPDGGRGDSKIFWEAVRIIGGNPLNTDNIGSVLTELSDLAHDIYYGVELAKQGDAIWNLMDIMTSESSTHRRQAAAILAGSVQNNPTALTEARKSWESRIYPNAGQNDKDKRTCEEENLLGRFHQSLRQETDPAAARAKVSALSGLSKDPQMRDCFVVSYGMGDLLGIFLREGREWDSTRVRIAQFIMDTFLDEDMGAQLGIWPRWSAETDLHCPDPQFTAHQGCWEYHLERMTREQRTSGGVEGWLSEFLRLLRTGVDALPLNRLQAVDREL